jgi:DNA-binding response OmpR family regulator
VKEKPVILLVDDHESIRSLCREELIEEGYEVAEARNGKEALERVEEKDPDLVVLGIVMPEMDGMETLPRMLRKRRNIPVILYTGYTAYREDFMTWAADAYVMKSSDLGELKIKIEEMLSVKDPLETHTSLDKIDQELLRILSLYGELTALQLWFEVGEDDAVKERVSEEEVRNRLESLKARGHVEKTVSQEAREKATAPIYRTREE